MSDVRQTAIDAHDLGLSVLPPRQDGSKAPLADAIDPSTGRAGWKVYQDRPASREQVDRWYANGRTGVGLVTGSVSGSLELFDFDDRPTYESFKTAARVVGLDELVERIEAGYLEETPSGGVHWLYFTAEPRGSTKLAGRPELGPDGVRRTRTLVETKGEGGYTIIAPSGGTVHPSGRPYRLLQGGLSTIVTITAAERDSLWALARTFDEPPAPAGSTVARKTDSRFDVRPGDDFEARSTWQDVLPDWRFLGSSGSTTYLRRPGKDRGVSAAIRDGRLNVYSTSTPFESVLSTRKTYSRFEAFAVLNHRGDLSEAAKALRSQGYGRAQPGAIATKGGGPALVSAPTGTAPGADAGRLDYFALTDEELGIVRADAVRMRRIRWVWPYRIAAGELTLIAGEGGLGKGLLLLKLAAIETTRGVFPDGSGTGSGGTVVIVSVEDNPETTLAPRLAAMGADLSRIVFLRARVSLKRPNERPVIHPVSFQCVEYWRAMFARVPGATMLLVDGLPPLLGRGVKDSQNNEVRAVLEPFIDEVIRPNALAMIAVTHMNKTVDARTPSHRILGSVAYTNLARIVYVAIRDPGDRSRRLFCPVKTNISPDGLPAIAFRVERRLVEFDGESIETAIPVFETAPVEIDVAAVMSGREGARPGPAPEKTARDAAWLYDLLAGQPQPTPLAEIIARAGDAGLIGRQNRDGRWSNLTALYRARDAVPTLDPPRAGGEIHESLVSGDAGRPGSRSATPRPRKHWELTPVEAPTEEKRDVSF